MTGRIEPGSIVGGSYQVVRSIGQGRRAEIFEATHARLGGRYAVKMLGAEVRNHPALLQRFARDVQVTSSLRHPGIVQVIESDTLPDGSPYLVVELLEGEDLGQVLAREGPLPLGRTVAITRQIASALAAAHRQDVIHRDLTPQDILLLPAADDERERVKVLDFGIAFLFRAAAGLDVVGGTPHLITPEQAKDDDDVDAGVDQVSLAAIVYEMLAGQPAFSGESPATGTHQIGDEDPVPLRQLRPELPAAIDAVLARARSKNRALRFPSIAEFSRELRVAAQTAEIAARAEELAPSSAEVTVIRAVPRVPSAAGARAELAARSDGRAADGDGRPHARQPEESAPVVLQAARRGADRALLVTGGSGATFRLTGAPRRPSDELVRAGARTWFREVLRSPRVRLVLGGAGAGVLLVVVTASMRGGPSSAPPESARAAPAGSTVASGQVSTAAPPSPGRAAPGAGATVSPGPTMHPIVEPIAPPIVEEPLGVSGTAAASDGTGGAGGEVAGLTFELASEPSDMPVWIDGKPYPDAEHQAHTSLRGTLPVGAHRIEIVAKEGYEPWRKTLEIRTDRANRFLARLKAKEPDELVQDLTPSPNTKPGATTLPATTPPAAGLVAAALVKPAASPVAPLPILPGSCTLSVGSLPWATIWVDGQSTGRHTPMVALTVPCGKHLLRLKRDDQPIDFTTEIVLLPGAVLKRVFQFDAAGHRLAK